MQESLSLSYSSLDLSFNHIGSIGSMEGLVCVEKLFLIQNKLTKIENLSSLHTLTMLELGSNRIRVQSMQNYSLLRKIIILTSMSI